MGPFSVESWKRSWISIYNNFTKWQGLQVNIQGSLEFLGESLGGHHFPDISCFIFELFGTIEEFNFFLIKLLIKEAR